jgi:hypothetical protein
MRFGFSTRRELEAWAHELHDQYVHQLAKLAFENHDHEALQELKHLYDWETDRRNHWRMR